MPRIRMLAYAACAAVLVTITSCVDDPTAPPRDPGMVPQALLVSSTTFKEVAAGTYGTCAITIQDKVVCWGSAGGWVTGRSWQIPWEDYPWSTEGVQVGRLAAGHDTYCAIGQDNVPYGGIRLLAGLRCWGPGTVATPFAIGDVQQYSVGDHHLCVIHSGGQLECSAWFPGSYEWDWNYFGQATVPADLGPVKQVSAGGSGSETSEQVPFFSSHTCVIRMDDTVLCWGNDGSISAWPGAIITPPADLGTVKQIEAGSMETCAIKTDDTIACWGIFSSPPPALGAVKQISSATGGDFYLTGNEVTCAIKIDDSVACWQWTIKGGIAQAPTMINNPSDLGAVQQVSVGGHICALRMDGRIQCWHDNRFGFGALDAPDSTHVRFRPSAVMTLTTDPSFRATKFGTPGVQTGTPYTVSFTEAKVVTNAGTISGEDAGLTYRFLFHYPNGDRFDTGYTSNPTITMTAPPAEAPPGGIPIVAIDGFIKDADGDVGLPVTLFGGSNYTTFLVTPRFFPTAVFAAPPTALTGAAFTLALSGAEVLTSAADIAGVITYDTISAADAGIEYAFDCGDGAGYGAFSSTTTASCAAGAGGEQPVKGKVRDSDGDETEYSASVTLAGSAPTPSGSDVVVQPSPDVGMTFDNVIMAGTTTTVTSSSGEPVPEGFQLGDPPLYWDIETTASFSGDIEICISYAGMTASSAGALRLLHGDGSGNWTDVTSSIDTDNEIICGTVSSLSPFVIVTMPNQAPVANASRTAAVVESTDALPGGTRVQLDGSASSDSDGSIVSWRWTDAAGTAVATGVTATVQLARGTHTLALTVTDDVGATSSTTHTVIVRDTRAPDIHFVLDVTTIGPPNGRMIVVAHGIHASDAGDAAPAVLVTVSSNEAPSGRGNGNPVGDWQVLANADGSYDVLVRANRDGKGSGRIYTIDVESRDASGNEAAVTRKVTVPHDQGRGR